MAWYELYYAVALSIHTLGAHIGVMVLIQFFPDEKIIYEFIMDGKLCIGFGRLNEAVLSKSIHSIQSQIYLCSKKEQSWNQSQGGTVEQREGPKAYLS